MTNLTFKQMACYPNRREDIGDWTKWYCGQNGRYTDKMGWTKW